MSASISSVMYAVRLFPLAAAAAFHRSLYPFGISIDRVSIFDSLYFFLALFIASLFIIS